MTQKVTVARTIRCPVDDTAAFITDPHRLFPKVTTFSRCRFVEACADGELWDVYLDSGTIHLGGRVLITSSDGRRVTWESVRGTRHSFEALVEPDGEGSSLTMTLTFSASGLGFARLSEIVGRGLVSRNLHAAAEEIRHYLEFEREPRTNPGRRRGGRRRAGPKPG
ncbi:MAG: SRPBCC family protein [Mycobacterium sp.]|uniref:SRPBCC family protein n=1 Tax=Mycobacterium sp. TaxID=1785 RepID=UPI001ECB3E8F|nr:SRPBCC family protein [Mycobacterium sp.]MBW0018673.1 SRPBCC family protein [Mycobacterium sp.]